jgi:hypothetical protein
MTYPPTITVGGSTSFNHSSGNESYRWDNALLTHIGSNIISDGASPTRAVGSHITAADNSLSAGVAPIRTALRSSVTNSARCFAARRRLRQCDY